MLETDVIQYLQTQLLSRLMMMTRMYGCLCVWIENRATLCSRSKVTKYSSKKKGVD